jgi:hypothetical protein
MIVSPGLALLSAFWKLPPLGTRIVALLVAGVEDAQLMSGMLGKAGNVCVKARLAHPIARAAESKKEKVTRVRIVNSLY